MRQDEMGHQFNFLGQPDVWEPLACMALRFMDSRQGELKGKGIMTMGFGSSTLPGRAPTIPPNGTGKCARR